MNQDIKKLSWNEIILVGERQNFERERGRKKLNGRIYFSFPCTRHCAESGVKDSWNTDTKFYGEFWNADKCGQSGDIFEP